MEHIEYTVPVGHELCLNGEDIRKLISGRLDLRHLGVPDDACVDIRVPGGGDWSGLWLDIDDENPVVLRWFCGGRGKAT